MLRILAFVIAFLAAVVMIIVGQTGFGLLIAVVSLICMIFAMFEKKETAPEKMVLIALMSALAVVGRILFVGIPGPGPATFIIIMTGMVFGGEAGFITGAITALASNLIMGQGPWTVWQMVAWGMVGMLSGTLSKPLIKYRVFAVCYSFVWGFLFGWVMNVYQLFSGFVPEVNWQVIVATYIASVPHDFSHAVMNGTSMLLLGGIFLKTLNRISVKYGLKEE